MEWSDRPCRKAGSDYGWERGSVEFLRHIFAGIMGGLIVLLILFFLNVEEFSDPLRSSPNLWFWVGLLFFFLVIVFAALSKALAARGGLRSL
jgi:hypothetical protein